MPFSLEDQEVSNVAAGLALDAVEAAGHGHPGTAVALAPVAHLLFSKHLSHDPSDPNWAGRDRFVLSCGHASMLLYAQLHLSGYPVSIEDLRNFRKAESLTPGHPEFMHTPGVEMTTGPLGQGLATAVGMAWASQHMARRFDPNAADSPLLSHVYVIASDGDLEEGITSEASSFAGLHAINNLTVIYDDNQISIDGDARSSFDEDICGRYQAYGWDCIAIPQLITGAIDTEALDAALSKAKKSDKPTLIALRTAIAFPSPNMTGLAATHGSPMGSTEVAATKSALGLNPELNFQKTTAADDYTRNSLKRGLTLRTLHDEAMQDYFKRQPELSQIYLSLKEMDISQVHIPDFEIGTSIATRKASQQIIEQLAILPQIVGGSADLSESNGVAVKNLDLFHGNNSDYGSSAGRRIMFGIREHAMAAFNNGVALASPLRPFGATFLIFSDYMRPSIRLASLMQLPVTWIFSHDSIGLGEDGPTHQPIEHLWSLRAIPGVSVIRPADANETAAVWLEILRRGKPSALVLSRQNLPTITTSPDVTKGAYIIHEPKTPVQVIVIATGSEVHLATSAAIELESEGISVRVVSAPCLEWFQEQSSDYQNKLLHGAPKISIEAGSGLGWHRYVGDTGIVMSVEDFGASAPPSYLFEKFGITQANLISNIKKLI